jgi:AraC-like DNA-binding protein
MKYQEYIPGDALKPYVKCYYVFESGVNAVYEDKAFATGCVEIMFNLGAGRWETAAAGIFTPTAEVELWGQVIDPLTFKSLGKNTMLGIRFYPHTASLFLNSDIEPFNNQVSNLIDLVGRPVQTLHAKLLDAVDITRRIELIEVFLIGKLSAAEKRISKITLTGKVINELKQEDFFDNIENVAGRYGISSRYLQKLFIQHTGLSPKLYNKINRFQNSLLLVAKGNASLTSIAYACGYFDQSHFIREFKSFTGFVPSAFRPEGSSAALASPNK